MRIIAIANQKGGCGKTTTSINFAAALAALEKRVLLVDLDPQGHSACGLGVDVRKLKWTLYDLMSSAWQANLNIASVIQPISPCFDLIASNEMLNALEESLVQAEDKYLKLKKVFQKIKEQNLNYDYILIDCPPNLGLLTHNALRAIDEIIIPVEPSFFSLHGLAKISETLNALNANRIQPIKIHALLTIFNSKSKFVQEVYEEVKSYFEENLFKTIIHDSIVLKEAASAGQSVLDYEPDSTAANDYSSLAVEYLERVWDHMLPKGDLGWDRVMANRLGPRRVPGGILFQALNTEAYSIEVVGDFNGWVPESLLQREQAGLWQKILPLRTGAYRYKLIVDGQWQMDPDHPTQKANPYGTFDSYLELH